MVGAKKGKGGGEPGAHEIRPASLLPRARAPDSPSPSPFQARATQASCEKDFGV